VGRPTETGEWRDMESARSMWVDPETDKDTDEKQGRRRGLTEI